MERIAVQSSEIAIVGYDAATKTLEITFRNGGVYHYSGVPASEYKNLMSVPSHGTYFHENIRDHYECAKIA